MRKNKETATAAIKNAIAELFPDDAYLVDASVVVGDPWGWGSEVATIQTEDGLSCMNYYESDWCLNSLRIQDHVRNSTGLNIFIECYNPAIHCVYWD